MLKNVFVRLLDMLRGRDPLAPSNGGGVVSPSATARSVPPASLPTPEADSVPEQESGQREAASQETFLYREAILGRDRRITGYQFMLQNNRFSHIRLDSRRIHHFCARTLVNTLGSFGLDRLLGSRLAFLDLPDSFLTDDSLARLPPANTVITVTPLPEPGAPAAAELCQTVARLRQQGYLIAIPDPTVVSEYAALLPFVDIVIVRILPGSPISAAHMRQLQERLQQQAPRAAILVRNLPAQEDFNFCYKIKVSFFQGPFITRRENWRDKHLSPSQAHLALLLARLRSDAETDEIVELIKHEPTLSLRLLRYVNSAANGLNEHISSIKHAFILLGREQLLRWLILLLYTLDKKSDHEGQRSAVLENALIRARMMETVAFRRPASEREELFLTGLLSLIDVILEIPLDKALSSLAVPATITQAILARQGVYADFLDLAIACEKDDMAHAKKIASQCGVSLFEASKCHLDALSWAMQINRETAEVTS